MPLRIFLKPNLTPDEQKTNLEYDINNLQIEFEKKSASLEEDFNKDSEDKQRAIDELDRIISIKRNERELLERPLTKEWEEVNRQKEEVSKQQQLLIIGNEGLAKREKLIDKKQKESEIKIEEMKTIARNMLLKAVNKYK